METRVKATRQAGNCAQEQRFDPVGDEEPQRKEAVRTSSCSFSSSVQSELRVGITVHASCEVQALERGT